MASGIAAMTLLWGLSCIATAASATPQTAAVAIKPDVSVSHDAAPNLKLGAFLMYDWLWYKGDGALQDSTTRGGDYTDETGFRRVRVAAHGRLHDDVGYLVSLELADTLNKGSSVELYQLFISYSGLDPVKLKFGQFFEPFSLEAMTSSRDITFMERSLPYLFYPDRNLGVGIAAKPTDELYLEGGVFANNADSSNKSKRSYTGRIAYAPWNDDGKVVHFGASASYRVPENNSIRYSQGPEAAFAPNYFSASVTDVEAIVLSGLEAAMVSGPYSLQGEYIRSDVSRLDAKQKRSFDGYYVYGSWFITGESRLYRNGRFTGIKPKHKFNIARGGWGAWELAARISQVKADNGRSLSAVTLGVNWYLNRDVRFMANYVQADYERGPTRGTADIFEVRGQVEF